MLGYLTPNAGGYSIHFRRSVRVSLPSLARSLRFSSREGINCHCGRFDLLFILEWTTSLDTSSRTLFVREGGCLSTSRRTSSYVITSDCY